LLFVASLLIALFARADETSSPTNRGPEGVYAIDLPTALRLADAQNLEVQIARERLAEAQAQHESAMQSFFPWISAGAGYRRHEGRIQAVDGTMSDVDKQSYAAGPVFSAQVVLGDAIYKTLAAHQEAKAASHALESQQQDATTAAAQGYYDLAKDRALVDVVREALKISQDYQRQLHDAVSAGIAFKGDELRVQVQTERLLAALRQAEEQQRVAGVRLAVTLRLNSITELVPQTVDLVPLTLTETNAALDSLVKQALRSRPELKQSEALNAAARATKNGAVYGPLIPTLSAQAFIGGLGGGQNDSTGSFNESEDYFVGLEWRIGPGGLFDRGRIHASEARMKSTHLAGERLTDEITSQVVEAHVHAQSLRDQLATFEKNLASATEALRLTRERKQFGVGIVLEDLQAQQDLTRARSDYLAAVAEYNKAQYALTRAVGVRVGQAGASHP
jgi:outer membrane protein TolC